MKKEKTFMRLHFPEDEARLPWLPMLLHAYAVIDNGVAATIKGEKKKRKVRLACAKGCSACCRTHKDIPVYPLELVGLYWFVVEKFLQPARATLKRQLLDYEKGLPCPFLISGICSVHLLRPIACRQFNVFSKPCSEGEDPFYTRRSDVLIPVENYTNQAFSIMLPFYGITDEIAKARAIKNRLIHTQARILQECSWKELARRMDDFDFAHSQNHK
jgi:Fe-S-cluster containining protein